MDAAIPKERAPYIEQNFLSDLSSSLMELNPVVVTANMVSKEALQLRASATRFSAPALCLITNENCCKYLCAFRTRGGKQNHDPYRGQIPFFF